MRAQPRKLRLTQRLMLMWLATALVALVIFALTTLYFQARESENARRASIGAAFGILASQVGEKGVRLGATARALAERRSVVSTIHLFATYFDPARDDGTIFAAPAQELSQELADLAHSAGVDWATIVGPQGLLGAYWRTDEGEYTAYLNPGSVQREMLFSAYGGRDFRKLDPRPAFLDALYHSPPAPTAQPLLVNCPTGPGPAVVVRLPVLRQVLGVAERLPGMVVLGSCLNAGFVEGIAQRTGAAFAIVGAQRLASRDMPVEVAVPATARALPAPGSTDTGALGWRVQDSWVVGAGDWVLDDGSRSTAMFVLGHETLTGQRSALLTAAMSGIALSALLIFGFGLLYLRREVTLPLDTLATAVVNVRHGRYEPVAGIRPGDELGELAAAFNHMTERIRAREDELRRLSSAVEQSPTSVLITAPDGRIEYVNPRYMEVTGVALEELVGRTPAFLQSGQLPDEAHGELWRTIKAGRVWRGELANRTREGNLIYEQTSISPIFDDAGQIRHFVVVKEDITERKKNEARISHLAFHDVLTDLPNRRLFSDRLNQALAHYHRNDSGFAVHLLDLDHFKDVNDSLGHSVGDELLRQVALRIHSLMRGSDTLGRFGGDEFAILQRDVRSAADAAVLAEKVVASFREPFVIGQFVLHSNTSIGIALPERNLNGVDELMSRADIALYKAKEAGRGGFVYFDDAMTAQVQSDAELTHELARALELGQFFLEYQPQIDLASGALMGVEALLRWRHPERGVVPPARFIPLAESRGMMGDIGLWVMAEACRQWAAWHACGLTVGRVAVNVSAVQLKGGRGFEQLMRVIERCPMPASHLEIEFTESAFMHVSPETLGWIARLRAIGVSLAIDDFGTGYSSLLMLRELQAHKLKIDREFVKDMLVDPNDAAIVRATVSLAKSLGMRVVAEGIESAAQAETLRVLGCEVAQGYLFARPLAAADVLARYGPQPAPNGATLSPAAVGSAVDNL